MDDALEDGVSTDALSLCVRLRDQMESCLYGFMAPREPGPP